MPVKISFVIVYYKSHSLLLQCIESVKNDCKDISHEFVIIDNSNDVPEEDLKKLDIQIRIIRPGYNAGFARGVNLGLQSARGEFISLVNQDVVIKEERTFERLIRKLKELPEKTILSCRICDFEGGFQQSVWVENPGLKREWMHSTVNYFFNPDWKERFDEKLKNIHKESGFVYRINAAFLIFSKSLVIQDNLFFDKDFFLYGEDIEWAIRCKKKGWRFYYFSNVNIRHIGSASSESFLKKNLQVLLSDWLFLAKRKGRVVWLFSMLFYIILWGIDLLMVKYERIKGRNQDNYLYLNRKMKFWLLRKYGLALGGKHNFSKKISFKFAIDEKDVECFQAKGKII